MALTANLKIDQGTTFEVTFSLKDDNNEAIDLSGFTARAKIRKSFTSNNSINFVTSINEPGGTVTLQLSANTTAAIHAGQYVYDCELVNGNTVSRFVQGVITISAEVTKNDP